MKENGKVKFKYSWFMILLALWSCWPVAILLIIKRASFDKKFAMSVGKIIWWASVCAYVITGAGLIICLTDGFEPGDFTTIVFLGAAGYALNKLSKKITSDAEKVKQYISIIVNNNVRQLDNIASATGKSYDVVKADLEKLIKKGYLKDAYINEGTREIVLPLVDTSTMSQNEYSEKISSRIVTCPCCGANNTIVGEQGECEYCGSPLK